MVPFQKENQWVLNQLGKEFGIFGNIRAYMVNTWLSVRQPA